MGTANRIRWALRRRLGRRDDRGQAMAVIVALIGVLMLAPLSVQVLATDQMPSSTKATYTQDAIEAARAGLSDYVNHLQGPYSYLEYCSPGFTSLTTTLSITTPTTSLAVNPLPAAVASGDTIQIGSGTSGATQTVTASAAAVAGAQTISVNSFTASSASFSPGTSVFDMTLTPTWASTWTCPSTLPDGTSRPTRDTNNPAFANYPNDSHWAPVHNATAAGYEAFQYVVDSAISNPQNIAAQRVVTYITGRAGPPGRYVYATLEATISLSPLTFDSSDCTTNGYQITVPSAATSAEVLLYGAEGGASYLLGGPSYGGSGNGDQVTVYPPLIVGGQQTWVVDPGMAGGTGNFNLVSTGYAPGGAGCSGSLSTAGGQGGVQSGVATGNGGGGGGASALCFGTTSSCTSGSQLDDGLCSDAYVLATTAAAESASNTGACVMAVAGGGGGSGGVGGLIAGGVGGFWSNAGSWTPSGQPGNNILGLGQAAGGAAGTNPLLGGTYKGVWAPGTAYTVNQVVSYGASEYAAISASTNITPSSAAAATVWAPVSYQGAWSATVSYGAGQTVTYGGSNYSAKQLNTNVTPTPGGNASWATVSPLCGSTAGQVGGLPVLGTGLSLGLVSGGGGGGGGGWCGGSGGANGGLLGIALGSGGGGGAGGSVGMTDLNTCPSSSSHAIPGYPIQWGTPNGDNGVVVVAFFAGADCPGTVLQYSASVQLVQPVPPNTA